MQNYPKIIVVEGGDGVGKTTQIEMLNQSLSELGYQVKVYKNPNDCFPVGKMIREQILPETDPSKRPTQTVLGIMMLAALREVAEDIVENHSDKDFIVLDRWHFTTAVYGAEDRIIPEDGSDLFHSGMAWRAFERLVPESVSLSSTWDRLFMYATQVIYLTASPETISERLSGRVGDKNFLDQVDTTEIGIRNELFTTVLEDVSDFVDEPVLTIDTTNRTPVDIHAQIVQDFMKKGWISNA